MSVMFSMYSMMPILFSAYNMMPVLFSVYDSMLVLFSVYDMVPHLTAVLGTMLPMLGLAKYDNMRWVFASGKMSFLFPCHPLMLEYVEVYRMNSAMSFICYVVFVIVMVICIFNVSRPFAKGISPKGGCQK